MCKHPLTPETGNIVEPMPDDVPSEEHAYRLYVLEQVRQGAQDIDAGRTSSTQEVLREIESW